MRTLLLLLSALALPAPVAADVIMPPPLSCPPGAAPSTGHMGPHCAATECATIADCDRWGLVASECAPLGLCLREQEAFAGRGGRVSLRVALGSCETDADCPSGIACQRVDRCVFTGARWGPVEPALVPPVASPRGSAAGCGAMGLVGLLVIVCTGASIGVSIGVRAARVRREQALRSLLEARRVLRRRELTHDDRALARAFAPLADRIRVEIDDEGEPIYALDEEPTDAPRTQHRTDTRG